MEEASILFVDDEEGIFSAFKRQISCLPVKLFYAPNGEEAIKILYSEKIDILISDERMPGMTGSELISDVRERFPNIVSIIITGYADFDAVLKSINSGQVYKYILKPWDKIEMVMTIKNAIEFKKDKELISKLKYEISIKEKELKYLKLKFPDIFDVKKDEDGRIIIDLEDDQ